jgi:hypothetical protein
MYSNDRYRLHKSPLLDPVLSHRDQMLALQDLQPVVERPEESRISLRYNRFGIVLLIDVFRVE